MMVSPMKMRGRAGAGYCESRMGTRMRAALSSWRLLCEVPAWISQQRKADYTMVSQQRSFHIIECPTGVASPHARLIVSGHGVPHESLTAFYEALQETYSAPTIHALLHPLLSFFSFLEQQEQEGWARACADALYSPCLSAMERGQFPPRTFWAGPSSQIQAAIRAYLLMQWECRTRRNGLSEELLLAPPRRKRQHRSTAF